MRSDVGLNWAKPPWLSLLRVADDLDRDLEALCRLHETFRERGVAGAFSVRSALRAVANMIMERERPVDDELEVHDRGGGHW